MFGGNGTGGQTCQAYWRQLSTAFKILIVSTLALGLIGVFSNLFVFLFADVVIWTVNKFQIWRLLTSFLVDVSIISVIFNLYIMSMSVPIIEKMYSTSYVLLECFIQTLICNVIFIVLAELFSFFGMINIAFMMSFGLMHLLFIFLWQRTAMNPQEMTRFCCFPCIMPMKYLPWCFFAFLIFFGGNMFMIVSCLIGYLQHMVLKRSLLQVPQSFYIKLQNLLPAFVKQTAGYVTIRSVEANLMGVCRRPSSSQNSEQNERNQQQRNPFSANQAMNERVDGGGQGVSIGSSSPPQQMNPADYKNHWLKNLNDQQVQERVTQQSQKPKDKQETKKKSNLLDLNEEHNETLRSDYPLNESQNEQDFEEENESSKPKK